MKNTIAILPMCFVAAALAAPVEVDTDAIAVDLDFRTGEIRVIADSSEILNLAWNDTVDWKAGGGSGDARLTVSPMVSETPSDVTSWKAGTPVVLASGFGEGVVEWAPENRGLYRVCLTTAGQERMSYFDCSGTTDLDIGIPVDGFDIRALSAAAELRGAGAEIQVELKDGSGNTLVEGSDYILLYANNKTLGRATARAYGVGGYSGMSLPVNFTVLPSVAATDCLEDAFLDTRSGNLVVDSRKLFGAIAWNSSETFPTNGVRSVWLVDGDPDVTRKVKVSCAVLASADVEEPADVDYVELFTESGEGAYAWKPVYGQWYQLKFEIYLNDELLEGALTRRVMVTQKGSLLLFR